MLFCLIFIDLFEKNNQNSRNQRNAEREREREKQNTIYSKTRNKTKVSGLNLRFHIIYLKVQTDVSENCISSHFSFLMQHKIIWFN